MGAERPHCQHGGLRSPTSSLGSCYAMLGPSAARGVATRASLLRVADAATGAAAPSDLGEVTVLPSGIVSIAAPVVEPSRRAVGVLQRVPVVSPGSEHLASAVKRASRLSYTAGIRNETDKERNKAARQMDTLMKELSVPLTRYLGRSSTSGGATGFPDPAKLHPFELTLLQLTIGVAHYKSVLSKVNGLRKSVQETGKSYASRAAQAPNKSSALEAAAEGFQTIGAMFQAGIRHIDDLKDIGKKLRALPLVDTSLPTLALVGAPNVGKSSLVKVLSSGTPEVCNYPFTTRSIKMGHFYLDGRKHQVTDTPGVMNRPDGERNKMEMLTLAALDYLPTYIVFVTDLTEECGTSAADQWAIRADLQRRYAGRAWLDVFSKADMLTDVFRVAEEVRSALAVQSAAAPRGTHSIGTDDGTESVGRRAAGTPDEAVAEHASSLAAGREGRSSDADPAGTSSAESQQPATSADDVVAAAGQHASIPASVLQMCLSLPDAARVSSVTLDGIGAMQQRVIDILTEHPVM